MRQIRYAASLLTLLAATFTGGGAIAADPEPSDLPEGILAKMKRMELKQHPNHGKKGFNSSEGDESGTCGSLNVGSVSGIKPGGAPREVTVIIKGDVVNTPKCR